MTVDIGPFAGDEEGADVGVADVDVELGERVAGLQAVPVKSAAKAAADATVSRRNHGSRRPVQRQALAVTNLELLSAGAILTGYVPACPSSCQKQRSPSFRVKHPGSCALAVYERRLIDLDWTNPFVWVGLFLAKDFVSYWIHRAEHRVRVLWASHMVHHSLERFTFT